MRKVVGSNPTGSTNFKIGKRRMDFYEMTNEQRFHALDLCYDSKLVEEALKIDDPCLDAVYNAELRKLLFVWVELDHDVMAVKLKME